MLNAILELGIPVLIVVLLTWNKWAHWRARRMSWTQSQADKIPTAEDTLLTREVRSPNMSLPPTKRVTSAPATPREEDWIDQLIWHFIHLIVVGQSGAGKTMLLHEMAERLAAGGVQVVVCDPDATVGDWRGCNVYGAGDNFAEIAHTLEKIAAEAKSRREERAQGQREFEPLVVVVDEYADVKEECRRAGAVVENLLRRARKLNMHLVVGVQDTQVRTMGFERKSMLLQNAKVLEVKIGTSGRREAFLEGAVDGLPIPNFDETPRQLQQQPVTHEDVFVFPEDVLTTNDGDFSEENTEKQKNNATVGRYCDATKLLRSGMSTTDVSFKLGMSTATVNQIRKALVEEVEAA